jgi:putative ABC transport system permease protein
LKKGGETKLSLINYKMFKTAIRFLLYDKPKTFGALFGIVISTFLVGQNVGIFIFLTNAMQAIVKNNNQYIWVVDDKTVNATQLSALDMRISRQLRSIEGVAEVYPLVVAAGAAKFENGKTSGLTLIGTQAPEFAGIWGLYSAQKTDLLPDGAIFTEYFDSKVLGDLKEGDYFEINGKKVYNAGLTQGVRGFAGVYGFTTIERARFLTNYSVNKANAFLIKWKSNSNKNQVVDNINKTLTGVRAWDGDVLAISTLQEVLATNGIAASFGSLIGFAILSGFVIIGLTLYSAAIDRIKDYGTLKAIGATNGYITRLILLQAFLVAMIGYVIGRGMTEGFRQGIAGSGTIFTFPLYVEAGLVGIILFISLGGSLFAIRRINSLEPAAVFRN